MKIFEPTYLYIKRHTVTGLKYFGKTCNKDPYAYKGSGLHWVRHFKKHGTRNIETLWAELFENKDDLVEFALFFSEFNNIVKSDEWANLIAENGLDGSVPGKRSAEYGKRISETHWAKGLPKELNPNTGSTRTQETKDNISKSKKGKPTANLGSKRTQEQCAYYSEIRKGKYHKPKEEIQELILLHTQIKELYNSKPKLEHDYIGKNGRLVTYLTAFAKYYTNSFGVSVPTIKNIITGKSDLSKYINE